MAKKLNRKGQTLANIFANNDRGHKAFDNCEGVEPQFPEGLRHVLGIVKFINTMDPELEHL